MMRLFAALSVLATASCSASPVFAQDTISTRLDKARVEVNLTENAAIRARAACERGDTVRCGTEARTAALAASRALYAVDRARELVTPVVAPSPVPTPPPATVFSLAPAPDADFGVSLAQGTIPTWGSGAIPGPYDKHEGAFRFVCGGDGPLVHDDPVVYPGKPGAAHLHQVWGNRSFNAFTTPETLAASASTNCNDTPLSVNRSSYWQPALLHDSGQVIRPDLILVYYKRKTASSPYCDPKSTLFMGICAPLPNRIKFVFGWDQTRPTAPVATGSAQWSCTGTGGHYPDLEAVFAAGCKPGDTLTAMTLAPNCWDGKNLDSADHRSHMAYSNYVRCPASHPFLIPQEENKAQFTVTADMIGPDGKPRIRLSSDHMLPGAKPGATLHADYIEAWQADAKKLWHDHCIEKGLSCSGGDLGNGQQLIGAAQPVYGWLNPIPRATIPAR